MSTFRSLIPIFFFFLFSDLSKEISVAVESKTKLSNHRKKVKRIFKNERKTVKKICEILGNFITGDGLVNIVIIF